MADVCTLSRWQQRVNVVARLQGGYGLATGACGARPDSGVSLMVSAI